MTTSRPEQRTVQEPNAEKPTIEIKTVGPLEFARLFRDTFPETVVQTMTAWVIAAEKGDTEYATQLLTLAGKQMQALYSLLEQAKQNPLGEIAVPISYEYPETPIIALDQLVTPTNNQ